MLLRPLWLFFFSFHLFLAVSLFGSSEGASSFLSGECTDSSCLHGGTCHGGVNERTHWCRCVDGFTGARCERAPCREVCANGGRCRPNQVEGSPTRCNCPLGYEGHYCEQATKGNVCEEGDPPCGEHGQCRLLNGSLHHFHCDCHPGWTGVRCSRACPLYCANGGRCQWDDHEQQPVCRCTPEFRDEHCETPVDECVSDADCAGNAHCFIKVGGGSVCACDQGFTGPNCTEPLARCQCKNGGICDEASGECYCPPAFTGAKCEVDVDECDSEKPCLNNGTCRNTHGGFECICPYGWEGERCEQNVDDCSPNPCLGGGTCVDRVAQFECICPPDRTGLTCELPNVCWHERPCQNGVCTVHPQTGNYTCSCQKGYEGPNCERDIDECRTMSCAHGTCINTPGSFVCECSAGWTGRLCDENIDECADQPCQNGGRCLEDIGFYVCACPFGFGGDRCETVCAEGKHGRSCNESTVSCRERGCRSGGICSTDDVCICPPGWEGPLCERPVDVCSNAVCNEGRHCEPDPESALGYRCACPAGLRGERCDVQEVHSTCSSLSSAQACEHGATCIDLSDGGYRCSCPIGFSGARCEHNEDDCKPGLCLNGGTCVDGINAYRCACALGWTGDNCQIFVDIMQYNYTDLMDEQTCRALGCPARAGDGRCDSVCNRFACGFDGGDCAAARPTPFSNCPSASYCAHVFGNGQCDEICNSVECLFDGLDCRPPKKQCPKELHCPRLRTNGVCDVQCNTEECGWDGGDCVPKRKDEEDGGGQKQSSGLLVLIVNMRPAEFVRNAAAFMADLSRSLRQSLWVDVDEEGDAQVYRYNKETMAVGEQIVLPADVLRSVVKSEMSRVRRSAAPQVDSDDNDPKYDVMLYLRFDTTTCGSYCFKDAGALANYIAAAQAKQELGEYGSLIRRVKGGARTDEQSTDGGASRRTTVIAVTASIVVLGLLLMVVLSSTDTRVKEAFRGNLKRPAITCNVIYPPDHGTCTTHKSISVDSLTSSSTMSLMHDSTAKRFRHDTAAAKSGGFGPLVFRPTPYGFTPFQPSPMSTFTLPREDTPLHMACRGENDFPNELVLDQWLDLAGRKEQTPLLALASNARMDERLQVEKAGILVEAMLRSERRIHLDHVDANQMTALHYAAQHSRPQLIFLLISKGASVHHQVGYGSCNAGWTAYHFAASKPDLRSMYMLCQHPHASEAIALTDRQGVSALARAALNDEHDDVMVLKRMILTGTNVNATDDASWAGAGAHAGRTALHYAAQVGNLDALKELLTVPNINRDALDKDGRTALHLAAKAGHEHCVMALIEAEATLDIEDHDSKRPAELAADARHTQLAERIQEWKELRERKRNESWVREHNEQLYEKEKATLILKPTAAATTKRGAGTNGSGGRQTLKQTKRKRPCTPATTATSSTISDGSLPSGSSQCRTASTSSVGLTPPASDLSSPSDLQHHGVTPSPENPLTVLDGGSGTTRRTQTVVDRLFFASHPVQPAVTSMDISALPVWHMSPSPPVAFHSSYGGDFFQTTQCALLTTSSGSGGGGGGGGDSGQSKTPDYDEWNSGGGGGGGVMVAPGAPLRPSHYPLPHHQRQQQQQHQHPSRLV